jgi:hypothetical protein
VARPSVAALAGVVRGSQVPVWLPWPLPAGWVFTGVAHAGDERDGARSVAVACTGPGPLGGSGELLLVAEEMGVGMGAYYAGIDGSDPGPIYEDTVAHAKLFAAGRPTAMWCVPDTGDRAVFVGEARGLWLWAILWPEITGTLMYDDLVLTDLRDAGSEIELLPVGALSPRLLV